MPSTTTPRLRLVQGQAKHDLVELSGRVTMGRLGSVELPLKDAKASREHARVFEQGGDWHVVDLNSTNGTQVNGAAITRRALRPGDEITIGTTVFVFEVPEPPPPPKPVAAPPPKSREPVVRRRAETAAPPPDAGEDLIVVKQRSLHYNRVEGGGKTASPLREDVGQRGALYRLLIILVLVAVSLIIFFIVTRLVASMVAPDEEEEFDEEVRARPGYVAIV